MTKLTVYQQGALTYLELLKKVKKTPAFAGFLDSQVFGASFGWYLTKKKRGYTDQEEAQFLLGFKHAAKIKKEDAHGRASQKTGTQSPDRRP